MALRVEGPEQQKHAQDKAKIADSIDDESFVPGPRIVLVLVPKSDQGIGAESHSFPTHKHQKQAIAQDQGEHSGGKKIEVGEEAPEGFVIMHVAYGINMDQTADARYNQDHHRGKWIRQKGHIDFQRS